MAVKATLTQLHPYKLIPSGKKAPRPPSTNLSSQRIGFVMPVFLSFTFSDAAFPSSSVCPSCSVPRARAAGACEGVCGSGTHVPSEVGVRGECRVPAALPHLRPGRCCRRQEGCRGGPRGPRSPESPPAANAWSQMILGRTKAVRQSGTFARCQSACRRPAGRPSGNAVWTGTSVGIAPPLTVPCLVAQS